MLTSKDFISRSMRKKTWGHNVKRKSIWKHSTLKKDYQGEYSTVTLNDGKKKRLFLIVLAAKKVKVMFQGSVSQAKSVGWYKVK